MPTATQPYKGATVDLQYDPRHGLVSVLGCPHCGASPIVDPRPHYYLDTDETLILCGTCDDTFETVGDAVIDANPRFRDEIVRRASNLDGWVPADEVHRRHGEGHYNE